MEEDHEDEHNPISPNHAHLPRELPQAPGGEEGSSRDPESKGRSMKIKIKMPLSPPPPPPPPPRPLPEPDNPDERSSGRYCCGKFFPSGKAWGGHKRHHALNELTSNNSTINSSCRFKKPKLQPSPPKKNTFNVSNEVEEDEDNKKEGTTPVCCLCGKNFPSMNALFGHMRFHRDRGWKGIKPPTKHASVSSPSPNPNPSSPLVVRIKNPIGSTACLPSTSTSGSSSPEGIAGVADLMGSLPLGWTTKDSRGRLVSCPDEDDDAVVLAALTLMRISRDNGGEDEGGGGADVNSNGGEDEASSFPCEVFTSRQARGDHGRRHNRVFEFDLNKPPQEE